LSQPAPATPTTLDGFVALTRAAGDRLRAAILRVLRADSFGVLELCHVFDMAQPALSHHLKVLHNAGLVARHREGNSIFYARRAYARSPAGEPAAARLQQDLYTAIDALPVDPPVRARLEEVYDRRRASSEAFFANHADALASQQTLISPASAYADAILAAWQDPASTGRRAGAALEVGPGDGELLARLARGFDTVRAIDSSERMLDAARRRCASLDNVTFERREFTRLAARTKYDLVVAAMVLHHMASPAGFFVHAARLLRPDGMLTVAELGSHSQEWVREACGDLWLGFDTDRLEGWAVAAGLEPHDKRFIAQKNGFRIQILSYIKPVGDDP
jgi:ArsR family transcriptional regulator